MKAIYLLVTKHAISFTVDLYVYMCINTIGRRLGSSNGSSLIGQLGGLELLLNIVDGFPTSLSIITMLEAGDTDIGAARKIVLRLSNDATGSLPPGQLILPLVLAKLVESWPIGFVVVLKVHIAVPVCTPELFRRHVLSHILVKLELLSRDGVDKRCDNFEEAPYNPGHYTSVCKLTSVLFVRVWMQKEQTVDDEGLAQALGVVIL